MKKTSNKLFFTASVVLLISYAAVTLTIGIKKEWLSLSIFWTIWLMSVLPAVVFLCFSLIMAFKNEKTEFFVILPIFITSFTFELISACLGVTLTLLIPKLIGSSSILTWLIELILTAVCAIIFVYLLFTDYISKNRRNIKRKVFYVKKLISKLNVALNSVNDENLKNAVIELKDDIRFSDPMSDSSVSDIEDELCETIDNVVFKIMDGADAEACRMQIQKARVLLRQRNESIKLNK